MYRQYQIPNNQEFAELCRRYGPIHAYLRQDCGSETILISDRDCYMFLTKIDPTRGWQPNSCIFPEAFRILREMPQLKN